MKVAIVTGHVQDRWQSCHTILKNILKSYESLSGLTIQKFQITSDESKVFSNSYEVSQNIIKFEPNLIVFADYQPVPNIILKFLDDYYAREKGIKPKLFFHLYGDFSLFLKEWLSIEKILKKFSCKFFAASHSQTKLVKKYISDPNNAIVEYLPFAVDTNSFFYDEKIRKTEREKLKVAQDEIVFLYTGRLTLQKNTEILLKIFEMIAGFTEKKVRLLFAGSYDDLGYTYFGKYIFNLEYQYIFMKSLINIKNLKMQFLGNKSEEELLKLYNLSDVYISLSTHNDEDFGMSPAEAFCTGMKGVLTHWGGLNSFELQNNVNFIDVEFDKSNGPKFNNKIAFKKILDFVNNYQMKEYEKNRMNISEQYSKIFSTESLAKKLKELISLECDRFVKFTSETKQVVELFSERSFHPFASISKLTEETYVNNIRKKSKITTSFEVEPIYLKLYESYLEK